MPYDFGLIKVIGPDISITTSTNNNPNFYPEVFIKDARPITSVGAH
ncbi:16732_t:CDS:1, partial [Gigaspora margarita]